LKLSNVTRNLKIKFNLENYLHILAIYTYFYIDIYYLLMQEKVEEIEKEKEMRTFN